MFQNGFFIIINLNERSECGDRPGTWSKSMAAHLGIPNRTARWTSMIDYDTRRRRNQLNTHAAQACYGMYFSFTHRLLV